MLQELFSKLMARHSDEVKSLMKHRTIYEIAHQIGSAWGPPKLDIGVRGVSHNIAHDGQAVVWLYAGRKDTGKDVAIFIDEHIANRPDLEFSSDWGEGAEPDLIYRYKPRKGLKIRFIFNLSYSENCDLVETVEERTVFKRVCK